LGHASPRERRLCCLGVMLMLSSLLGSPIGPFGQAETNSSAALEMACGMQLLLGLTLLHITAVRVRFAGWPLTTSCLLLGTCLQLLRGRPLTLGSVPLMLLCAVALCAGYASWQSERVRRASFLVDRQVRDVIMATEHWRQRLSQHKQTLRALEYDYETLVWERALKPLMAIAQSLESCELKMRDVSAYSSGRQQVRRQRSALLSLHPTVGAACEDVGQVRHFLFALEQLHSLDCSSSVHLGFQLRQAVGAAPTWSLPMDGEAGTRGSDGDSVQVLLAQGRYYTEWSSVRDLLIAAEYPRLALDSPLNKLPKHLIQLIAKFAHRPRARPRFAAVHPNLLVSECGRLVKRVHSPAPCSAPAQDAPLSATAQHVLPADFVLLVRGHGLQFVELEFDEVSYGSEVRLAGTSVKFDSPGGDATATAVQPDGSEVDHIVYMTDRAGRHHVEEWDNWEYGGAVTLGLLFDLDARWVRWSVNGIPGPRTALSARVEEEPIKLVELAVVLVQAVESSGSHHRWRRVAALKEPILHIPLEWVHLDSTHGCCKASHSLGNCSVCNMGHHGDGNHAA